MSNRNKFILNGLLLTVVGFAMRGVALFLGAYITSMIGAEGIGLQGLIATVYSFAVTFATSGVGLSVTRLVASAVGEGRRDSQEVMRGAFIYAVAFGLGGTLLMLILSEFIGLSVLSDIRTLRALRILSLSLLPIALSSVIYGYFVAVRRVTLNALVQVFGQIMRIALTVVLLLKYSSLGVEAAISALAFGTTVTETVCFLLALFEYMADRRKFRKGCGNAAVGEVARIAMPLALSQYVRSFLLSVEHSIIPRRLTERGNTREEALASYGYLSGMALPIILFPMTPLSSFSGLLVPEFAECEGRADSAKMSRIASESISKALSYAMMVAVFIFAFSEELGYVIYDTYEAGHYIGFLDPVIPLMYLDHVTDSMLKGIGEQVYSMWVNILDSFLSVILVYLLIPIFDISGYALVIIIMELFNFVLSFIRLNKRVSVRLRAGDFLYSLFSSSLAVTLTLSIFEFSGRGTSWLWLAMKIIFALCVFVSAMLARRFFDNCDKRK